MVKISTLVAPQVAYNIAREMRGLPNKTLTEATWLRFLKSEHSPIRIAKYKIAMDIPYWVAMHFRTHWVGIEHYISTSRTDITKQPRDVNRLVHHVMICNPQSIISMSRKRLCYKASTETRQVMEAIRRAMLNVDNPLYRAMLPDCEYRKGCYELKSCGWYTRCCKERLHDLP